MFNLCKRLFPYLDFEAIQLNFTVKADKHVDRNSGVGFVLLLGFWKGGKLCLEDGSVYSEPGILYRIPLNMPHWVTACTGERFSVVFYAKAAGAKIENIITPAAPKLTASSDFILWGTQVRSRPGTAATPTAKRICLAHLVVQSLCLPRTNGDFVRRLAAQFTHPFLHPPIHVLRIPQSLQVA